MASWFHLLPFWLQILVAINSSSYLIPDIVSHLLCTTIWSGCAQGLESEHTPISWAGPVVYIKICCTAQIPSGTCMFVPMHYLYSETNKWCKDWVRQCVLLWSETWYAKSIKCHFTWKSKNCCHTVTLAVTVTAQNLHWQRTITFFTQELIQYSKTGSTSSESETPKLENKVCSANWACQSDPPILYLNHAPRAQPLILHSKPSGTDFGSDRRMTCRGSNLDPNLISSAWPTSVQRKFYVLRNNV